MLPNACPKPISPPKAPKGVRKRNPERSGSEFKRCYHSRARQKFVNLQECLACGAWGYSQNAHVLGVDGAKLKGPYTSIASLCGVRPDDTTRGIYPGCHALFDEHQDAFRAAFPEFNPKRAAREIQRRWLAFVAASQGTPTRRTTEP